MIADAPGILTFDADRHEYRIRGEVVPSVTQVLKLVGAIDDRWYHDRSAQLGTAVAEATALDDRDDLDPESVDDEVMVYVEAWRRFLRDSKAKVEAIEKRVCNPLYGYAGTLDRHLRLNDQYGIWDIKTGGKYAWHPLQTAGYAMCCDGYGESRGCIYLRDDGTYRVVAHTELNDLTIFASMANAARWLIANGRTIK